MKTLLELNSKWYWRLPKVLYFLIVGIALIASIFGYYEEFKTYDPNDLKKITADIEEANTLINDLEKEVESLNHDYSSGNLWKTASGSNLRTGILFYILSKEKFSSIEGVYTVCAVSTKENCEIPEIDRTSYGKYKKTGIPISVPKYQIDEFNQYTNIIKNLKVVLDNSTHDKSSYFGYDLIKAYNEAYGTKISTYRDHHGINEYTKILLSFIATAIGIACLTLIIRSIAYYVIIGISFPKE